MRCAELTDTPGTKVSARNWFCHQNKYRFRLIGRRGESKFPEKLRMVGHNFPASGSELSALDVRLYGERTRWSTDRERR